MIEIEANIKGKAIKTEFAIDDMHNPCIEKVMRCLEGKTIDVPDTTREWVPPWWETFEMDIDDSSDMVFNRLQWWVAPKDWDKEWKIDDWGLIQIPILNWLPMTCRSVTLGIPNRKRKADKPCYGQYYVGNTPISHAFKENNQPSYEAFAGEIALLSKLSESQEAFCFVLAHEIQHAINKLPAVYPALIDWKGFKNNVIGFSSLPGDFGDYNIKDEIIDSKIEHTEDELETLEKTFGPSIHEWFKSFEMFADAHPLEQ